MTTARFAPPLKAPQITRTLVMALGLFGALVPLASAQQGKSSTEAMLTLPDSPGAVTYSSSTPNAEAPFESSANTPLPMALPSVKFISAGQAAPPQTAGDKVVMGLRESVTPFSATGWLMSASYAHVTDTSPNFGTNKEAFAQRLGGAAALGVSKEIFSDSIMAPVFHQDPRYYQLGRRQPVIKRGLYAATRCVIGRTDGGRTIPNFAFIAGTAGAAVLTKTYYPHSNQSATEVAETFGTSLGGTALGYLISEFGGDITRILHLTKHE